MKKNEKAEKEKTKRKKAAGASRCRRSGAPAARPRNVCRCAPCDVPPLPTAGNLRSASRNAPLRAFPQRPTIQPYATPTAAKLLCCNYCAAGRIRTDTVGFGRLRRDFEMEKR